MVYIIIIGLVSGYVLHLMLKYGNENSKFTKVIGGIVGVVFIICFIISMGKGCSGGGGSGYDDDYRGFRDRR